MIVFVVLVDAMGGTQSAGVKRTRAEADSRAKEVTFGKKIYVVEHGVLGDQPDSDTVFIAQIYDRMSDIHNFLGVYGNHDDAKRASGEKGQVLSQKL